VILWKGLGTSAAAGAGAVDAVFNTLGMTISFH
jgi:homoserine kinase